MEILVGDAVINRDTPIVIMLVALVIIISVFKFLDYVSAKNKRLEKMINPEIVSLVKNGNIDKEGMTRARIGIKEFESFMRLAGIRNIDEIDISNLEINGQISFIKKKDK